MDLGGMFARTASTQVFHQRWKNFYERLCPPVVACGPLRVVRVGGYSALDTHSSASEMPRSLRFLLVIQLPFWPMPGATTLYTPRPWLSKRPHVTLGERSWRGSSVTCDRWYQKSCLLPRT